MESPYSMFKELRPEKKLVAEALAGLKFESVLEVGSQWGEVLVAIKDKFPEIKMMGIDIDKEVTNQPRSITNLDLKVRDVLNNTIHNKEFDVVVSDALFCMMRPDDVEQGFKEMVRMAKKYIVLVELLHTETGFVHGGRTGANWPELFKKYGLTLLSEQKITKDMWEATPWSECGHVYLAGFEEPKTQEISQETGQITKEETIKKAWCDTCDSKGVRHKKVCPKTKK